MALDDLLQIQAHDTSLEQLRHQLESIPEREALAEMAAERAQIDRELAGVADSHGALARDQRRLEDEVALIEAKAAQEQQKLYGGSVTSPKEAQALQDEVESLKRHQSSLEDRILDLMESIEPLNTSLSAFEAAIAGLDERRAAAEQIVAERERELHDAIDVEQHRRIEAVAAVDDELLARYEAVRSGFGSSAVVRFDGKNCVGCPLSMPAVEVDRVKKAQPGTLVDCQECGRLVVR